MIKKIFILIVSVVALSGPAISMADSWELALKSDVTADPQSLTLRDVALAAATSEDLLARYGHVPVVIGKDRDEFQASDVLVALSKAGIDLSMVRLSGATAAPTRAHYNPDVLSAVKDAAIRKIAEAQHEKIENVDIDWVKLPEGLPLRSQFMNVEVALKEMDLSKKTCPMEIKFVDAQGKVYQTMSAEAHVSLRISVVVAKEDLNEGTFVTADVFTQGMRTVSLAERPLRNLDELGGTRWQLKRGLRAGEPLTREVFQITTQMQKGSMVTLLTKQPGFQIRTLARVKSVMEDGLAVVVENMDSKKEIIAKPISASEVQVVY